MIARPAFVALGDIHLAKLIWTKQPEINGDAFAGFRGFVDHAIRLHVPMVICGDLFDVPKPDSDLIEFFRHEMDRAAAAGVQCYGIQGNHDKRHIPWYVAVSQHPIHIGDGVEVTIGGIRCCGFDYALKDEIEARLADMTGRPSRPQVLFLHQAVRQALKFDGAWNCDLDWVPDGIPLTIIGDIHHPLDLKTRTGTAHYTGASHARAIDQVGPKTCMVINDDLTFTRVPIPARHIRKFYLGWGTGLEQLTREIVEFANQVPMDSSLPTALFLTYATDQADKVDPLVAACQRGNPNRLIWILDEADATVVAHQAPAEPATGIPTRPIILGRCLDREQHPGSFQLALDLLDPPNNPQETVRAHRERFMVARSSKDRPQPT